MLSLLTSVAYLTVAHAWTSKVLRYTCQDSCCDTRLDQCNFADLGAYDSCLAAVEPSCIIETTKRITLDKSDVVIGPTVRAYDDDHINVNGVNAGVYFTYRDIVLDWPRKVDYLTNITISWALNDCFSRYGTMIYFPYNEKTYPSPALNPPAMPGHGISEFPSRYFNKTHLLIPATEAFQFNWFRTNGSMALVYLLNYNSKGDEAEWPKYDPALDLDLGTRNRDRSNRGIIVWDACDFAWTDKGPYGELLILDYVPGTFGATPGPTISTEYARPVSPGDLQNNLQSINAATGNLQQFTAILLFIVIPYYNLY